MKGNNILNKALVIALLLGVVLTIPTFSATPVLASDVDQIVKSPFLGPLKSGHSPTLER